MFEENQDEKGRKKPKSIIGNSIILIKDIIY
jgi:hypothetical protein